ncbi:hypothetical protein Taro_043770 [Colocasia esculenta]|uniref:Cytochrome b5 heme-binding domain-containing protein n=1 Tax=Colocasia esculenta TaxID=4460 RepID=A0A843WLY0_COLES|nr:hypothetical protein [Colocasia esculenta]
MAGALQLWETLKEAITAYTGLSPAAFFTILAVAVAFYHVLSGFFRSPAPVQRGIREPEEEMEPLPPPVQLGEITAEELKAYDGSDPKKPLLMAIKGQIYDVSQSRVFYGPGGPYAIFAGRDASRALAKMSFDPKDLTGDISGLGPFELEALQDWEYKFMSKYVKVGTVEKTFPVTDESTTTSGASEEREGAAKPVEASPADSSDEHVPKPPEANVSVGHAGEAKEADARRKAMAAVLQLWETLKEAITAYTGLSPAAFFTIVAVAVAFYHVVAGFLTPSGTQRAMRVPEEVEPLPEPVQLGEVTEEELKAYNGADPKMPLLMAIKGQIYDVSRSRSFYGPGGPYAVFAGRDASRALAKMSFEEKDLTGDVSGLGPFELDALQDWEFKFMTKYVKVGTIKKPVPATDESTSGASEEREAAAKPVEATPADTSDEHVAKPPEANSPADHAAEESKVADGVQD